MTDYFGAMGTALYNTLSGGSALVSALGGTRIYCNQAPDNASRPYVIFNHQGGGPQSLTPKDMRSDVWYVRAFAATQGSANLLDGLCEVLLHKKQLTVSGYTNFWTFRESNFSRIENLPNGEKVYSSGGFYRIRLTE